MVSLRVIFRLNTWEVLVGSGLGADFLDLVVLYIKLSRLLLVEVKKVSKTNKNMPARDIQTKFSVMLKIQVVIAIVALSMTILVLLHIGSLIKKDADLVDKIGQKQTRLEQLEKEITEKKRLIESLTPSALKGLGFKKDSINQVSSVLQQSVNARDEANEIIKRSSAADIERRKQLTVEYFPKKLDKEVNINIVIPSLQEFGFSVEKKKAIVKETQTNAIWFGTKVKPEDVKLVAYTLISAGIKIKLIQPFQSPSPRKDSLIQIGAKSIRKDEKGLVDEWPEKSVEDIRNIVSF